MSQQIVALAGFVLLGMWGPPPLATTCSPHASEVVRQFLSLDFEGYRLSSEGHEAIWQLTDRNGEPPEEPLAVTKDYRITSAEKQQNECRLRVRFSIYGYITETGSGLVFRRKTSAEEGTFMVKCANSGCKISLDFKDFKLGPHPGKNAVRNWLDRLESIQATSQEKQKYHALRERIASLD